MSEQPNKPTLTVPFVIPVILVGMLAVLVVAILWLNADWVPPSITSRLHGATESEVRGLLGDPEHSGLHTWAFRRPARFAEFQVRFSEDGRVESFCYDR